MASRAGGGIDKPGVISYSRAKRAWATSTTGATEALGRLAQGRRAARPDVGEDMQLTQQGHNETTRRWSTVASVAAFALAAWAYLWLAGRFPFYFIWDMDLATVLDVIVLRSGLHPDHVNHPGFGMYLVLDLWIRLTQALGMVSAVSLDALASSMSPLACVAELTDAVRALSPIVCLASAFCLGLALLRLLRLPAVLAPAVYAVLLTQSSLFYHASMNRTELYAVFFWSLGLLGLACSADRPNSRGRAAWLLGSGLCLGLAILTKLQVVLYVLATPFFFAFVLAARGQRPADCWPTPASGREGGYRVLAWANLTLYVALLGFAWFVEPPDGVWSFTERYRPTLYAGLFLLLYLACALGLTGSWLRRQTVRGLLRFLTLLGAGLPACSLLFFLVLPKLGLGWQYLLVTYKMTFLRGELFAPKPLSQYLDSLVDYWRYEPATLAVFVLAVTSFLHWARRRRLGPAVTGGATLVAALGLGCAVLSARPILRDWLWWETILGVWTMAFLLLPWGTRTWGMRLASLLVLAGLCLGNVAMMRETLPRLDAVYSQYGFNPRPWLSFVFFGSHQKYKAFIRERYGYADDASVKASLGPELTQATRHVAVRRLAAYPFPGRAVDLRQVSLVAPGFPVLQGELALRLTVVPPELAGAVVVDALAARALGPFLPDPPKGEPTEEWAFAPYDVASDRLVVLPRKDLTIWLFEPSETGQDGPVLEAAADGRTVRYVGRTIDRYTHLALPQGSHPFFVVTGAFLP